MTARPLSLESDNLYPHGGESPLETGIDCDGCFEYSLDGLTSAKKYLERIGQWERVSEKYYTDDSVLLIFMANVIKHKMDTLRIFLYNQTNTSKQE
jgi:hypothetical protein